MRKIIYFLLLIVITLFSCDDMEARFNKMQWSQIEQAYLFTFKVTKENCTCIKNQVYQLWNHDFTPEDKVIVDFYKSKLMTIIKAPNQRSTIDVMKKELNKRLNPRQNVEEAEFPIPFWLVVVMSFIIGVIIIIKFVFYYPAIRLKTFYNYLKFIKNSEYDTYKEEFKLLGNKLKYKYDHYRFQDEIINFGLLQNLVFWIYYSKKVRHYKKLNRLEEENKRVKDLQNTLTQLKLDKQTEEGKLSIVKNSLEGSLSHIK